MTAETGKIHAAAFHHLRLAGLKYDDPDMAKLFDLSAISVRNGRVIVPPAFIRQARAERSDWFFDAMTAPQEDIGARVANMAREHAREQFQAEQSRFLDGLRKKYCAAPRK